MSGVIVLKGVQTSGAAGKCAGGTQTLPLNSKKEGSMHEDAQVQA